MQKDRILRFLGTAGLTTAVIASACSSEKNGPETQFLFQGETPTAPVVNPDALGTAVAGTQAFETAVAGTVQAGHLTTTPTATETTIPTATGTPTPTLTSVPTSPAEAQVLYDELSVWEGEFTDNDIRRSLEKSKVFETMRQKLLVEFFSWATAETQAEKDKILRQNSTLSSLINPFGRGVDADPAREPGLGQTISDIEEYDYLLEFFQNASQIKVEDLAHLNENGLYTMGVYAPADDRDAATAILALAWLNFFEPGLFGKGANIEEALSDAEIQAKVNEWQDVFFAETQERSLGVSDAELRRRQRGEPNDASNGLPAGLRDADQWESCDAYRIDADSRERQLQSTRGVRHESGGKEIFTESDTEDEFVLWVLTVDPETGVWDVDAFTDRGYADPDEQDENQIYAASGEELRPCGQGAAPAPAIQPQPGVPQQGPGPGPEQPTWVPPTDVPPTQIQPTPVPTNPHIIPTATQGPAPTNEATATDVP